MRIFHRCREKRRVEEGATSVSLQATLINDAARNKRNAEETREYDAKHKAGLKAGRLDAAKAPAEVTDDDDDAEGACVAETVANTTEPAPEVAPEPDDDTAREPQVDKPKVMSKKASTKAEPKKTSKQKAEEAQEEHDRPLKDAAQAEAAKQAANFVMEWIAAKASDRADLETIAHALRKATAVGPAIATLRHLLLEVAHVAETREAAE